MDVEEEEDEDGGAAPLKALRLPPVSTAADLGAQLLLGRLSEVRVCSTSLCSVQLGMVWPLFPWRCFVTDTDGGGATLPHTRQ